MYKRFRFGVLDDARALLRDYGIDQFGGEGNGTAEGFATYLFVDGGPLGLDLVAHCLKQYKDECAARGTDAVDAELFHCSLDDVLSRRAKERETAARSIRNLKATHGDHAWGLVAQLATTSDTAGIIKRVSAGECQAVLGILLELDTLSAIFDHSLSDLNQYVPGEDSFMDHCIALDIVRFDTTLMTAKPWDGSEEDVFEEANALYQLISSGVIDLLQHASSWAFARSQRGSGLKHHGPARAKRASRSIH